ncbi:MAG: hypothetical protein AB7R67_20075 [Vicinamibacterales bacterium]
MTLDEMLANIDARIAEIDRECARFDDLRAERRRMVKARSALSKAFGPAAGRASADRSTAPEAGRRARPTPPGRTPERDRHSAPRGARPADELDGARRQAAHHAGRAAAPPAATPRSGEGDPDGTDLPDALGEELTADLVDGDDAQADYDADIARGHRQPRSARDVGKERASGTSWWLGKSREQLSAEASTRMAASAKTKVGQSVKGTVNTP